MNKIIQYIGLVILSLFPLAGLSNTAQSADSCYHAGNYMAAKQLYLILVEKSPSSENFYNLGNTYYQLGIYAEAIYFYRKALLLNPSNEDAQFNLVLAQKRLNLSLADQDEMFFVSWLRNIKNSYDIDGWVILSLCSFALLLLLYLVYRYFRLTRYLRLLQLLGIICFVLSVISIIFAYIQYRQFQNNNEAVVMRKALLYDSPSGKVNKHTEVTLGTTVELQGNFQAKSQVMLPNGTKGWINTDVLRKVKAIKN